MALDAVADDSGGGSDSVETEAKEVLAAAKDLFSDLDNSFFCAAQMTEDPDLEAAAASC